MPQSIVAIDVTHPVAQEALYGRAPASTPASFGRFEELAAARLAGGATPLQRHAQARPIALTHTLS
jgi:hypothetical protein